MRRRRAASRIGKLSRFCRFFPELSMFIVQYSSLAKENARFFLTKRWRDATLKLTCLGANLASRNSAADWLEPFRRENLTLQKFFYIWKLLMRLWISGKRTACWARRCSATNCFSRRRPMFRLAVRANYVERKRRFRISSIVSGAGRSLLKTLEILKSVFAVS